MQFSGSLPAATSASSIGYRPDIDGLRAVAVLCVILAHAGVPFLKGGFLGVDVFFVISGYLITSILLKDLGEGRFNLLRFYERRARRILPALILVLVASIPFALWLMLPDYRQNFFQSVVATLLFSNNILLALTTGYWDLESEFKPLLHTWSLGVEEQFYLAFPLMLAAFWRFGRRSLLILILALCAMSFGISEHGWRNYPDISFYSPLSRGWELMVGCAGAFAARRPRRSDQAVSIAALFVLLASFVVFDEQTPSPSYFSAVPVLATLAIILFNREGLHAYRALSLRPIVFLGLISYSAYLWHQPLFAFARLYGFEPPSAMTYAALSVLTLVLAALTWRFVEEPFRKRDSVSFGRFAALAGASGAALLALGLVMHLGQGFPRWTFPQLESSGDVHIAYNERIRQYSANRFPDNGRPNLLVLGRSYGRDAANVLMETERLPDLDLVYFQGYPACAAARVPEALYEGATAIVIASGPKPFRCIAAMKSEIAARTSAPVFFASAKHFGYNLNPLARMSSEERKSARAQPSRATMQFNAALRDAIEEDRFIDLIAALGEDGETLRYVDEAGNPLSPDRLHLTRYGAQYAARSLLKREDEGLLALLEILRGAPPAERRSAPISDRGGPTSR